MLLLLLLLLELSLLLLLLLKVLLLPLFELVMLPLAEFRNELPEENVLQPSDTLATVLQTVPPGVTQFLVTFRLLLLVVVMLGLELFAVLLMGEGSSFKLGVLIEED